MSTNYHTDIAVGAAANASVFNSPLAQLDTAITSNATSIAATTAEVVAARAAYPNLDARLTDLILSGGNVATKANGVSAAGQKVLTVDSTTGFIVGAYVTYLLNGATLEGNTIGSIQAGVSLTLGTNIGATPAGGVLDDTYISMISTSEYLAAQAIPHAGTLLLPDTMEYANGGVYNAEAFGASPSASAAVNTAAIQDVIDAIEASSKPGVCLLQPGTYSINDQLTISASGVTIAGAGADSVLSYDGLTLSGGGIIEVDCGSGSLTNVVMRDFAIVGNYTFTSDKGIRIADGTLSDSRFERLTISDCGNTGIYSHTDVVLSNVTIEGCTITHCGDFGITLTTAEYCNISDNFLDGFASVNYPAHGVYLKASSSYNTIANNRINAVTGTPGGGASGIAINGAAVGTRAVGNVVTGNVCVDCLSGTVANYCTDTVISTNVFIQDGGTVWNGIYLYADTHRTSITGNTLSGGTGWGVYASDVAAHTDLVVSGNAVYGFQQGDKFQSVTRLSYSGNSQNPDYETSNYAVYITGSAKVTVAGNAIACGDQGLRVETTAGLLINANTFTENVAATNTVGIYVANTCSKVVITGNDLSGLNSAYSLLVEAADYIVSGNITYTDNCLSYTTVGAGSVETGKATAREYGDGTFHYTKLTLTLTGANDIDLADGADHGTGVKVYTFPAGRINVLGATINGVTAITGASGGGATMPMAVGTVTAGDEATLTGTEADIIPSTAIANGASTFKAALAASAQFDGTTTAVALYVNAAVLDTVSASAVTIAMTGTMTITWVNLGDY